MKSIKRSKSVSSVVAVAILAVSLLAGCATNSGQPTNTPTPTATNPYGGFKVDNPKDTDVVLTVTGTKTVDYTMGQLKSLAGQKISILEPFVKKRQTFDGVPLKSLLESAGISPTDKVDTIALNQYEFADTAANLESADAILAVSRDSKPIAMDEGGPIRLVFATKSKYFTYLDAWNWSLRTIKVVTK
jgi:hypothetical protein